MTRKRSILGLVLLAAVAAGWWLFYGRGPVVTTVAPTHGTAVEIVYATGAVEPVRRAKVTSLIRGRIVDLCYCESEPVKKGDLLVRLDDREFSTSQPE